MLCICVALSFTSVVVQEGMHQHEMHFVNKLCLVFDQEHIQCVKVTGVPRNFFKAVLLMQTYLEMDWEPIQIYLFPTGKQGKVLSKGRQSRDREREGTSENY